MTRPMRILLPSILSVALAACGSNGPAAPTGSTTAPAPTAAPSSVATAAPIGGPTSIPVPTDAPLGDHLVATITVPQAPCAMAVDATSVWITGSATGELVRIDPATNLVSGTVKLETGAGPCGVAVGPDGRIWVALLGVGAVVAVDPQTMQVTGRVDHVGPQLWDLKAGLGAIWVSDRTAHFLLRIDPKNAKLAASIPIGPLSSGVAVVKAGVWVSDDSDQMLRRIDPATNKVAVAVVGAGAPSWFADDADATLLISERGGGKVLTVDAATGALGEPSTGWNEPLDGTVFGGRAWIPEGSGRRVGVLSLDAPGSAVVRYALPGAINPFVAEPGFGDIWVLDFGGTTIWRLHP